MHQILSCEDMVENLDKVDNMNKVERLDMANMQKTFGYLKLLYQLAPNDPNWLQISLIDLDVPV